MIHVVPLNDERQHEPTSDCWCEPTLDFVDPETGQPWASENITGECVENGKEWILLTSDGELIEMSDED